MAGQTKPILSPVCTKLCTSLKKQKKNKTKKQEETYHYLEKIISTTNK